MAFFKFRKGGGEDHAAPAPAAESIEAMRTRARHRLIGASVLVLLGVIGFPMLFDNQPRPISVDIPIEIPDKNTVKPLATTSQPKPAPEMLVESDAGKEHVSAASTPVVVAPAAVTPAVVARPAPVAQLAVAPTASRASTGSVSSSAAASLPAKPVAKPANKPEPKPEPKPAEKPASKAADKPADKPAAHADDGAKAQALLEGKDTVQKPASTPASSAGATSGRYIVQVGAYADGVKAHEVRMTLEKAGLKTYAQVVQPKEGKRFRVRVGPFESKAEADKVAEKVRKLELPAAILEL